MTESEIIKSREGSVLRLTLNRPERLNAVSEGMYELLIAGVEEADSDPEVRCMIIAGAGRAFCVGADLKDHASGGRDQQARARYVQLGQEACACIQEAQTPVIAAVHGYAVGAGAEIAVSADFLIFAEDARMRFPEVSIGTFVGGGVSYRLPRLVGLRRATELLMLGEWFTGTEAHRWGLANEAPDPDSLDEVVKSLASKLASKAPLSVQALKRRLSEPSSLTEALDAEAKDLLSVMQSQDWAEGVAAFAEQREPRFTGA